MAEKPYIHPEDDTTQGNPPVTTSPPATAETEPNPNEKANELVKRFFSSNIPEPKLDQNKLDRINRMGKINQIGQSVGVLGDVLGLALGANVRKKDPDTTTPRLQQEYQNTLDRYKDQKDIYDVRNFQKAREDAQFGLSREDRDRANELANAQLKAKTEEARAKATQDWQKFLINTGLSEKKQQALEKHYGVLEGQGQQKIVLAKAKAEKTASGKPFVTVNIDGKDKPLTEGEYRAAYERAKATKGWTKEDMATMMAGYENQPLEASKDIVQRFMSWEAKQNQQAPMIYRPAEAAKNTINPSPSTGTEPTAPHNQPVGTVTGPPKQTKQKPAYSSLNF